jgi:cell division protein FtsN
MATLSISHWLAQPDPNLGKKQCRQPPRLLSPHPALFLIRFYRTEEVDLTPDIEPAELTAGSTHTADYLLQVGSFRQEKMPIDGGVNSRYWGLEAAVELTDGDNGRWYRVTMGPFASRSEIARARSKAAQANMDTLLLKRESP